MSWSRAPVAKALVEVITAQLAADGIEASVQDHPTFTVNPPAIVVGRPSEVRYGVAAFGIDEIVLPVACVCGPEQDDAVHELLRVVHRAVTNDPTLGGVVMIADMSGERAWRNVNVAGADYLAAEAVVDIQQ
jgi:hypothetical protein